MNRRCLGRSRLLPLAALGAIVCLCLWGCDETFTPCMHCGWDPVPPYSAPTAPESLITNLQVSYRRREVREYAKILAPEFTFRLQPLDAAELDALFWSRDQDSTGTGNLFQAPEVSEIRIDLLYGLPEPANEVGMPAGAVKVRILQTDLQVDVDLMTLLVTDQQDMFFRRGFAEAGEDTTHWFLFEWRDLPTLARPGLESFGSSAAPTPTVASLTWWKLKTLFGAK